MTLLDGKKLATQIKSEIKEKVLTRAAEGKKNTSFSGYSRWGKSSKYGLCPQQGEIV